MPDLGDGHTPRLTAAAPEPGPWGIFKLVPAGENRFVFQSHVTGGRLVLDLSAAGPADPKTPAGPAAAETIAVYSPRPTPTVLQAALTTAVRSLADAELAAKTYDKTRQHKTKKYVKLPDPTLKDPLRTKRHEVLAVEEDYRIEAQLDGKLELEIPTMLYLAGRDKHAPGVILLAVAAELPIRGRVQWKMPNLVSVSTGYRTRARILAVAEVQVRRVGGDLVFSPPAVKDLQVSLSHLQLSNDLLDAARHQVEHMINHELREGQPRICRQANKSLEKAMASRDLRIPLLGYLDLL
jgi:hypothetical protein